jgi:hypothetical protein
MPETEDRDRVRTELRTLIRLVREERRLLAKLQRWWLVLVALTGLCGCDTIIRVLLWTLGKHD